MRAFKAVVDAGVGSLMPSHNELNGVPCHANKWLLTKVLREEWGWKGLVSSDFHDIQGLMGYRIVNSVIFIEKHRLKFKKKKQN